MKINKRKVISFFKISGLVLLLLMILLFIFRNTLLDKIIHRIDSKLEKDYQCNFTVKKAEFNGLTHLEFHQLSLVPQAADTLIKIDELHTSVNFWKLLLGDIQLGKLEINKGYIQLVKTKTGSNYEAFLRSKKDNTDDTKINYAKLLNRISSKLLNLVPTDMNVKGFSFRIDDKGNKVDFDFETLALSNKKLTTLIQVNAAQFSQEWTLNGFADPRDRKADIQFYNTTHDTLKIPYLDQKYHLKMGFQSIHFNLENLSMDSGTLHFDGYTSIENLLLNHPKVASKDVVIPSARFDFHWLVNARSIALDSTSILQLNHIKCQPYLAYTNEKDKTYDLHLQIPKMKAQDFINSLPSGLFHHIEGMQAEGNFSYALNFHYNNNKPDALVFDSKLAPEGLKITKYGEADLNKLNGEFSYRAIEKGVVQRPVWIGSSNPYFTPLNEIAPYLKNSILTSEDPSFFSHRGFITEAFKQSIAKNIRTKKFSRGASTISMQLVKNVYLTREKTLSRKLEEILLVYMLENNHIVSKERMLEVYCNIIEWGPNVYGIGEAAAFYFQKKPIELTLNECLFLATIIPRPKGFMYRFDTAQRLKPFAKQQNSFLTKLMLRRNLINPTDTIGQHLPLTISGSAKFLLKQKPNTIENDSIDADYSDF